MWLLLQMPCQLNYFQGSGLPLSVSGYWSGSMCRAYIALQELQTVAMMQNTMAFQLSGMVVALHLENSTTKAYLCNQGGTVSPFLSRLSCQILSQTHKHSISLIPAYIPTHLNVEANYLSWGWLFLEWLFTFGVNQKWDLLASSSTSQCQHYYTLKTPLLLGSLGMNAFNYLWNYQVSYVFAPALVPLDLSKFLDEDVTGQSRVLILVAPCWMEAPWLPTVPNMLKDVPQ